MLTKQYLKGSLNNEFEKKKSLRPLSQDINFLNLKLTYLNEISTIFPVENN